MLRYLPGCTTRPHHPEALSRIPASMESRGAAVATCCNDPGKLLEPGDAIVANCTMCDLILRERYPESRVLSLYEWALGDSSFPWHDHRGEAVTVQDCWRARGNRPMQEAVRACLRRMNFTVVEQEARFEKADFCGVWLWNESPDATALAAPRTFAEIRRNHVRLLPPDEQKRRMEEWVKRYRTDRVLCYCNGCEAGLRLGGIAPTHLVELVAEKLPAAVS